MAKVIAILLAVVALIAGLSWRHYYYPPVVLKRQTVAALTQFNDIVAGKDRAKISAAMNSLLAENAKIHLEVAFFSIGQPDAPASKQDFDKPAFLSFIDNVLYPLTDYAYEAELSDFTLNADRSSADIRWTAKAWADGLSYYGGVGINMRSSTQPDCRGEVVFANSTPQLSYVSCTLTLHMVPKPGETDKLKSLDSIKDMLKQ